MSDEELKLKLKSWLKDNGVMQKYVAENTGLSCCSISLFLSGKRRLNPNKLQLINDIISG